MSEWQLITPVVFTIFNLPGLTDKVFKEICKAKPSKLFIIADGPRPGNKKDEINCKAVRKIVDRVDWNCELTKIYSEENLGCGKCISQGIIKVFESVDHAIILEDDCLPSASFIQFCRELLGLYANNNDVTMISGSNYLQEWKEATQSYHYSRFGSVWGWATWRRAWNCIRGIYNFFIRKLLLYIKLGKFTGQNLHLISSYI